MYPIWKFHKEHCPDGLIVNGEAHLSVLEKQYGKGWVDSPTMFDQSVPCPVVEQNEVKPKKSKKPKED